MSATVPRVLVVEDDEAIQGLLRAALELSGMEVHVVADGRDVVRHVLSPPADLVLLDLTLPDQDGLDLLEELRRSVDVPVIVVSARGAEGDRVLGLNLGADDFIVKPFSPRELVARVRSVLRRSGTDAPLLLERDGLRVDLSTRDVTVEGVAVDLTRLEFDLLVLLATHPRRVWTRDELLRSVWHSSEAWQSTSTVTEIMRRLRVKLGDDPIKPRWIRTVRGVGYRFESAS